MTLFPPPPLKRRDSRSAGYTGGPVNNIEAVSFPGYTGESIFSSSTYTWGKSEKVCYVMVDGGIRTHDPKKSHDLSTTPFVKVLQVGQ